MVGLFRQKHQSRHFSLLYGMQAGKYMCMKLRKLFTMPPAMEMFSGKIETATLPSAKVHILHLYFLHCSVYTVFKETEELPDDKFVSAKRD